MASSNFLQVKTHLSEFKGNSEKDTLSEASESGTSNSVTSAEDLQKLAVILGLNSAEDVYQERFRVDRRRLEAMLAENLEESQTAQVFFNRVMTDTNTLINWPARLKIGARSKKDSDNDSVYDVIRKIRTNNYREFLDFLDPHVRVAGRPDDVKLAREKIMHLLDTRNNRVTMKIDVSYTDHSHIIGKGGLTIKRVMEETGCHIHFPDSNRTSAVEKSNQVSIAGDMERVERARARVRALTPLVFSFELPIVASPLPDLSSPYVHQIQEQYKVQVMLRNRPKLHAHLVVVKGVQWEVRATMEATSLLMRHLCGPAASQTQVQMSLEISPMHHGIVVGRGAEQLKSIHNIQHVNIDAIGKVKQVYHVIVLSVIMQGTNTQIMFPDADDPNIPMLRKSCVTITGQIKDVYDARQQLVGSLPLVVIFDVSEESCCIENDTATTLMEKFNVYINIRRKPKQGIASIVIKGIERCAGDIYEARRSLIGGSEPAITAEVPESYNIPPAGSLPPSFRAFNPFSPSHAASISNMNSPRSPYLADMYNMGSPMFGHNPPTPGGFPSPLSPGALAPLWLLPSPPPRAAQFSFPGLPAPSSLVYKNQPGSWNPLGGQELGSPQMMQYQPLPQDGRLTTLQQILNSSSAGSSGYQSNFTGSSVSLDGPNTSGGEAGGTVPSPSVSPISSPAHTHSPAHSAADRSHQEIATIVQEVPLSERRAPGCEKKTLETLKMSPPSDYHQLKAEAGKLMREPVGSGYRLPTTRWSGYYFSHTSPGSINLKNNDGMTTPEKGWNRSELVRPKIELHSPPAPGPACRYQQLYDLLQHRSLHKYIDLFKQHEVDLCTFASLNEADLTEIGVKAFGARRKMLLIIAELQKQTQMLKSSATPKAERKLLNSPPYNAAALAQDKW